MHGTKNHSSESEDDLSHEWGLRIWNVIRNYESETISQTIAPRLVFFRAFFLMPKSLMSCRLNFAHTDN